MLGLNEVNETFNMLRKIGERTKEQLTAVKLINNMLLNILENDKGLDTSLVNLPGLAKLKNANIHSIMEFARFQRDEIQQWLKMSSGNLGMNALAKIAPILYRGYIFKPIFSITENYSIFVNEALASGDIDKFQAFFEYWLWAQAEAVSRKPYYEFTTSYLNKESRKFHNMKMTNNVSYKIDNAVISSARIYYKNKKSISSLKNYFGKVIAVDSKLYQKPADVDKCINLQPSFTAASVETKIKIINELFLGFKQGFFSLSGFTKANILLQSMLEKIPELKIFIIEEGENEFQHVYKAESLLYTVPSEYINKQFFMDVQNAQKDLNLCLNCDKVVTALKRRAFKSLDKGGRLWHSDDLAKKRIRNINEFIIKLRKAFYSDKLDQSHLNDLLIELKNTNTASTNQYNKGRLFSKGQGRLEELLNNYQKTGSFDEFHNYSVEYEQDNGNIEKCLAEYMTKPESKIKPNDDNNIDINWLIAKSESDNFMGIEFINILLNYEKQRLVNSGKLYDETVHICFPPLELLQNPGKKLKDKSVFSQFAEVFSSEKKKDCSLILNQSMASNVMQQITELRVNHMLLIPVNELDLHFTLLVFRRNGPNSLSAIYFDSFNDTTPDVIQLFCEKVPDYTNTDLNFMSCCKSFQVNNDCAFHVVNAGFYLLQHAESLEFFTAQHLFTFLTQEGFTAENVNKYELSKKLREKYLKLITTAVESGYIEDILPDFGIAVDPAPNFVPNADKTYIQRIEGKDLGLEHFQELIVADSNSRNTKDYSPKKKTVSYNTITNYWKEYEPLIYSFAVEANKKFSDLTQNQKINVKSMFLASSVFWRTWIIYEFAIKKIVIGSGSDAEIFDSKFLVSKAMREEDRYYSVEFNFQDFYGKRSDNNTALIFMGNSKWSYSCSALTYEASINRGSGIKPSSAAEATSKKLVQLRRDTYNRKKQVSFNLKAPSVEELQSTFHAFVKLIKLQDHEVIWSQQIYDNFIVLMRNTFILDSKISGAMNYDQILKSDNCDIANSIKIDLENFIASILLFENLIKSKLKSTFEKYWLQLEEIVDSFLEKAESSIKTTGGGLLGFAFAGPVGAVAGGTFAHYIQKADKAIEDYIESIGDFIENKQGKDAGKLFEFIIGTELIKLKLHMTVLKLQISSMIKNKSHKVWDESSEDCSMSGCKNKLTIGKRHHCRLCGAYICSSCCGEAKVHSYKAEIIEKNGITESGKVQGSIKICKICGLYTYRDEISWLKKPGT